MQIYDINGNPISFEGDSLFSDGVDYSNNIATRPDCPNVVKVASGWEQYSDSIRAATAYPNGVLWGFRCEPEKYYRLQPRYQNTAGQSDQFTRTNPDSASQVNDRTFICSRLITPKSANFASQDGYISGSAVYGLPRALSPEYAEIYDDDANATHRAVFLCKKEFWIYWCTSEDVSDSRPYIGGAIGIVEIAPVTAAASFPLTNGIDSSNNWPKFEKSYTSYNFDDPTRRTYSDTVNGVPKVKVSREVEESLFRTSRDVAEYKTNFLVFGDSIASATSNAGAQNAWKKYLTIRLNLGIDYLTVNGTGIIKGVAFDWSGNAPSSENYNAENSGCAGIEAFLNNLKQSNISLGRLKNTSVAVVALGTNDWGNNGTLGSVDTLNDETTFYGAVKKTFTLLHDDCGIPAVVFVAPFKRQNWNQNNSATVPYTIYDMCHALAEIALLLPDMHVVDTLDRWYLNYDDTAIRAKSFIDYVHITPYAHHLFTIDLAKEIRAILSAKGIV